MNNITLFLLVSICIVYILLSYIIAKTDIIKKDNKCFENFLKICDCNMKYYNSLVFMLFVSIIIVYYVADSNNYVCLYNEVVNEADAITRIKNLI